MTCPVTACRLGPDDDFLRPHEQRSPQILASLRATRPGFWVYYHRVLERLVDPDDGEIVLVLEGGHIVEIAPRE